jgi:hypothetical protein
MTGPEHYQYAEKLLDDAGDDELGSDAERYHVAKAQAHATLALAAATGLNDAESGMPPGDWAAWRDAAAVTS